MIDEDDEDMEFQFSEANPFASHLDNQSTLLNTGNKQQQSQMQDDSQIPRKDSMKFENSHIGVGRLQFEIDYAKFKSFPETLKIGSPQYKEYIQFLAENGTSNQTKTHICLPCWQLVSMGQKYSHQRLGHICIFNYDCKNEEQFLKYASQYGKTGADKETVRTFTLYER